MRGVVLTRVLLVVLVSSARAVLGEGAARADEAPASEVAQARHEIDVTLAQMSLIASHVRDDLRITRQRGTKVQVACVDQALSRADVTARRARETANEELAAYARGDIEAARAARHRLGELRELERLAGLDGAQCSAATRNVTQTPTTVNVVSPTRNN